jgi:hypothetical protein
MHASAGATPAPPGEWRNRMAPRVATRHQSLKRGQTGLGGNRSAIRASSTAAMVSQRTCATNHRDAELAYEWYRPGPKRTRSRGDRLRTVYPFTHTAPGGKHGPTAAEHACMERRNQPGALARWRAGARPDAPGWQDCPRSQGRVQWPGYADGDTLTWTVGGPVAWS